MTDRGKRPAFQWYPGDHRRDTAVQACTLEARGLWFEMLNLMHDGVPYGHLTAGGDPIDCEQLARMVGITPSSARTLLKELERRNVFSRTAADVIYSRRMVKDERKRNVRASGGSKSLENPNVPRPKEGVTRAGKDGRKDPSKDTAKDLPKDTAKDGGKDTFRPSFGESLGVSPAVAVCSLQSALPNTAATAPPEQTERAALWELIRRALYVPDGNPPIDWAESRDGSILRELEKRHSLSEIAAAIEGLALVRDRPGQFADAVDWIRQGEKLTLRALYNSHSGVLPMFSIATQAYWKRANARATDRSKPQSIGHMLQLAAQRAT